MPRVALPVSANVAAAGRNRAVAMGDFDGDGWLDVACTSAVDDAVDVYANRGGTFAPVLAIPAGPGPEALAAGDLDGDGRADLVVAATGDNAISVPMSRCE